MPQFRSLSTRRLIRPFALSLAAAWALAVAGCDRPREAPKAAVPAPAAPLNGSTASVAAPAPAPTLPPASASASNPSPGASAGGGGDDAGSDAQAALARFRSTRPAASESCFQGLPPLEREPARASFRGAAPSTGSGPAGRVLLVIDASGSMAGKAGGGTKMQAAKEAAAAFAASLPPAVSTGLMVFGHQGSNRTSDKTRSCAGVDLLVPVAPAGRGQLGAALERFGPTGWTPLAAAIEQAGRHLGASADGSAQAVYIVSDGEESCGGDPVAAARALRDGDVRAIVNIVGFDLGARDRAQLKAVADAGGGAFTEVQAGRAESLGQALQRQNHNFSEQLRASNKTFGAKLQNDNRTFARNLKLQNCVSGEALQESNALHGWIRDQKLPKAQGDSAQRLLASEHAAFEQRAKAYAQAAETARDGANRGLDEAQQRVDRDAAQVR